MQKLLHRTNIPSDILAAIRPPVLANEIFLLEDSVIFLPEKSVILQDPTNITLDYLFDSKVELSPQ